MTPKEREQLKWAMDLIREKMESEFFGELLIKFQDGRIVLTEIKEQKKPPKC